MNFNSFIPLELCHVGEPFFIRPFSVELTVQQILGQILRFLCLSGAAEVCILDGRFDVPCTADAQHTLVVDMNAPVVPQIIIDPAVALSGCSAWIFSISTASCSFSAVLRLDLPEAHLL